ncbi:MAG: hypothetical protein P8Y84_06020 [Desulfuromonadales bacterium]|jgi:hypothetical protein
MWRLAKNLQYLILRIFGHSWMLYCVLRRFEVFDELLVRETSQLCIDGFPRSANTFLTLFFSHWNPNAAVAHHVHLPLQVRMAVKYRVPTIVLIRPPLDAITSLLIREKFLHLWVALIAYRLFYRQVARYRESFVLADFATSITAPEKIIEEVNIKFKKSFHNGTLTDELKEHLFVMIDGVNTLHSGDETTTSRPSRLRNDQKRQLTTRIKAHRLYAGALRTYLDLGRLR